MNIVGMVSVMVILLMPWWAYAQQQTAHFESWRVLSMQEKTGKVCYVTSTPVKKGGNVRKREQPYVMVTMWGQEATEVSVVSGYPYKTDSAVTLTVDDTEKYRLFSNKKILKVAWANTPAEHQKIIASMLAGDDMVVKGIDHRGASSQDRYALKGFSKAYKAMQDLCKTAAVAPEKPSPKAEHSSGSRTSRTPQHSRQKPQR